MAILIDGDGNFNKDCLLGLTSSNVFLKAGLSYYTLSIIGPQSSGKSTLLNALYGTSFEQLNKKQRRGRTTSGIWLDISPGSHKCTLLLDVEGFDGSDRAMDATNFESRYVLFALAVSDVVIVNMWDNDVGREVGGAQSLFKSLFGVLTRLYTSRKTTIMFVIRDKSSNSSISIIEETMRENLQKIWESLPLMDKTLDDFFNFEFVGLSSIEENNETDEVYDLQDKIKEILLDTERPDFPSRDFIEKAEVMWTSIKENQDLNIPDQKVALAMARCGEILDQKYQACIQNEYWRNLLDAAKLCFVPDFIAKITSPIQKYISEYEEEAKYYEETVRKKNGADLKKKLMNAVRLEHATVVGHMESEILRRATEKYNKCLYDGKSFKMAKYSSIEESESLSNQLLTGEILKEYFPDSKSKIKKNLNSWILEAERFKVAEFCSQHELQLKLRLNDKLKSIFRDASDGSWHEIRSHVKLEVDKSVSELQKQIIDSGIKFSEHITWASDNLRSYARKKVERMAKEEASRVELSLNHRFGKYFLKEAKGFSRIWAETIPELYKLATTSCVDVLAVLAAIRLEDYEDTIKDLLIKGLLIDSGSYTLSGREWEKIPEDQTLITPDECVTCWSNFIVESSLTKKKIIDAQVDSWSRELPPSVMWLMMLVFVYLVIHFMWNPYALICILILCICLNSIWGYIRGRCMDILTFVFPLLKFVFQLFKWLERGLTGRNY